VEGEQNSLSDSALERTGFEVSVPHATMWFECRPELTRSCGSAQNPAQVKDSGKVPKTHSVGSVGDHNLGVFTITEIALKIANAVPPTHLISGAPNAAYVDL
jgi:hypothetical protein